MATIIKLLSGQWRVQIRRKPSYVSQTFLHHEDARKWATAAERRIDLGETPLKRGKADPKTLAHLIDLHVDDMREVGKAPRRSRQFTLDALKAKLGRVKHRDLIRSARSASPAGRSIAPEGVPATNRQELAHSSPTKLRSVAVESAQRRQLSAHGHR